MYDKSFSISPVTCGNTPTWCSPTCRDQRYSWTRPERSGEFFSWMRSNLGEHSAHPNPIRLMHLIARNIHNRRSGLLTARHTSIRSDLSQCTAKPPSILPGLSSAIRQAQTRDNVHVLGCWCPLLRQAPGHVTSPT